MLALAALAATLVVGGIAPASGRGGHHDRHQKRGKSRKVEIEDFAYHPGRVVVSRGTRVVFANRDSARHTATRHGSFATGVIRPGRSASVRFRRPGVYRFHCTIHPFMHGKIVVRR